jgi:Tfp pilus assembly protein PilF
MIKDIALQYRVFLTVYLLASLTGCQTFNGMVASWNRPSHAPSAVVQDEPAGPLTNKQKADVQIAIARSLENQGDTTHAIKNYLEVVKKDPNRADAYHRLAVLHDAKGDSESARQFYQIALKKDPKNPELCCDFGYSCYLQKNWKEAEPQLRRALALNADCARAHTNLGLLLARTGREDEALVEFGKAGCDEAAARTNLGFALTLAERWPEAKQQFELALKVDPQSKMAKDGLAAIRWRDGESKTQEANRTAQEPNPTPLLQASYDKLSQPDHSVGPCWVR